MIRAAGILFIHEGQALFLKRGPGSDFPGAWCFPGGEAEGDEAPEATAERETIEELGFLPDGSRRILARRIAQSDSPNPTGALAAPPSEPFAPVDYTTFLQPVAEQFAPQLNGEHTAYAWADLTTPPEPLHPGARVAIDRLTMNELGVARAIASGDLTSPQKYENVWLFAIRITGTGVSFRPQLKEHVWRDPAIWLTDEAVARTNGLSVIWVHPEKALLTSDEFADRVIGSVMLPYISGDELWGIAKIYDDNAAEQMQDLQFSTSPGVNFGDPSVNSTVTLEDGRKLLVEGDPSLLDHIAVVPLGVWDKSGPPTGVLNNTLNERADSMAETEDEKKAREDAARRDAAGNIDKILAHLDSKFDAASKRMDAMEEERKADKRRADAARRDAEREEWMKKDAADCEREDAAEKAACDAYRADGDDEDMAMDKARKDRRARMDKRRADGETEEAKEAKEAKAAADRKDAEEKARKDAEEKEHKARVDSLLAGNRDLAGLLANVPMQPSDPNYTAVTDTQATYDPVFQAFGDHAPAPFTSENPLAYRKRLARHLQRHSAEWKHAVIDTMAPEVLTIAESQIRKDALVASRSTDDIAEGVLIPRTHTDADTGHRITEFRGRTTIFKQFSQPSMRVTKFHTARRA